MAAVTLTQLRAKARELADMVNSQFITDTADSLDQWINEGAQKLHDLYVQAYGEDYVEKSATLTTVAGQTDYTLPADFYKLLGIELPIAGKMRTLVPFKRSERNGLTTEVSLYSSLSLPRYKLSKGVVRLLPAPGSVLVGKIWYSPLLQVTKADTSVINLLVDPGDSINFENGAERYVIMYAARKAKLKQEDDVRDITADLEAEEQKLQVLIEERNAADPKSAVDVEAVDLDPWEAT